MKELHYRKVTQLTHGQSTQRKEKQERLPVAWEAPIILPRIKPSRFSFLTNFVVFGSWVLTYSSKSFFKSAEKGKNTSSTTGWKLWKFCLKPQDVQLKTSQNLTKKLLQHSTASNQGYQKDTRSSHILHPPTNSCGLFLLFYWHIFHYLPYFSLLRCGNPHGESRYAPCTKEGDGPWDWAFHRVCSCSETSTYIFPTNFLCTATVSPFVLSLGFLNTDWIVIFEFCLQSL